MHRRCRHGERANSNLAGHGTVYNISAGCRSLRSGDVAPTSADCSRGHVSTRTNCRRRTALCTPLIRGGGQRVTHTAR
ncbi:hypothetical protein K505DRAFT_123513 [Melanomma pulvis-pyrius CBS 109.77]|uniref:Uncharacterized protein n=1 Tax=Melanomma pulvis-pyrius CBS 109.77 TaxID=1314802 RepID=A0A6A6WU25_9PLEO|nr:hypothetical protein K505DRAFT_123513 [Melanomma pulvis-pyrius CBS 109.77]